MLKGHSYNDQIYYSVADRLINNTFLNGTNGIFQNEGSGCSLSNTSNSVTISDGFFIVQGGLTEIVNSETLQVVLDGSYCVLVYELDMSKDNTDTSFVQGQFKVLTGQSSYPALTKQKLTENTGIYQYEFARFRALTTGITDFVDNRTFLDYNSIFEYIQSQIELIEDNGLYVPKTEFDPVKEKVAELDSNPKLVVSDTQPTPISNKTIVWIKPKE
ncbi:MAG TPA: hypothetical protein IAB45_03580 [Candidatus Onthousia faecavium]|nr:hypothetical protein [Candidatus Onthousia faecavium]